MKEIYPNELVDIIKQFNYIPRKLSINERLKLYHRYWIPDFGGMIKVKDICKVDKVDYYIIKYKDNLSICFPHPLDDYETSYELLHDYTDIHKENIINSGKAYSGAEIKYWFTINRSRYYSKFLKYLTIGNKKLIQDNKKYFVIIDKMNNYRIEPEK